MANNSNASHDGAHSPYQSPRHGRPMSPASQASDPGAPAHPQPEGARDLRGSAYDARINGHRELMRRSRGSDGGGH